MRRSQELVDDHSTVFRDVIFIIALVFILMWLIAIFHINPEAEVADETIEPPGAVLVNIFWKNGLDSDVDLWVKGPKDKRGIGYSNKSGLNFNLLRDDLGNIGDITDLNFENAYTRGISPGEYIINVHMFSNRSKVWPMTVTVLVTLKSPSTGKVKDIANVEVELHKNGDEITAIRFNIDEDGVVSDVNNIQKPLRNGNGGNRYNGSAWSM